MKIFDYKNISRSIFIAAGICIFLIMCIPLVLNARFAADDIIAFYLTKNNFFPFSENWSGRFTDFTGIIKPQYFFRPVYSLLFKLNFLICGYNPHLHVLTNVVIALIALFVFYKISEFVSVQIFRKEKTSGLFLFFLLLYPPLYYNIAWISGKADLLILLFTLASSLFAFKYITDGKRVFLFLSVISFILALLTKDNGVLFFPVEALIIYGLLAPYLPVKKYRNVLFFSKLTLSALYLTYRIITPGLIPPLNNDGFELQRILFVPVRALAEFLVPVDSGQLVNLYGAYTVLVIVLTALFSVALAMLIVYFLKSQNNKFLTTAVMVLIPLTAFVFYIFEGKLSYRFYVSGFAFFLVALSVLRTPGKNNTVMPVTYILLIFFAAGSINTVNNWVKAYRTSDDICNALINGQNNETELVVLNYPHSFNNAFGLADLGYYFNFVQKAEYVRNEFIKEGASMVVYSPSVPDNIRVNCKKLDSLNFILKTESVSAYFYPVPFFGGNFGTGNSMTNNDGIKITALNSVYQKIGDKIRTGEVLVTLPFTPGKRKIYYFTEGKLVPAG